MKLIDGQKIANKITRDLKEKMKKSRKKPFLAVILIGDDPASHLYVTLKEKKAKEIGLGFEKYDFLSSASEEKVVELIKKLNQDKKVHGIIVQLPLPPFFDPQKVVGAIAPEKDVDGFGPKNRQLLLSGREPWLWPVLPTAILKALQSIPKSLKGKTVRAVVNSEIFGKILGEVLRRAGAKYEYLVKKVCLDKGLENFLGEADVVISVTGCMNLIKGHMIKEGAVLIDAGISRLGGKLIGDVDFELTKHKAGFLTPTPGGIGPITVTTLLENVYLASKLPAQTNGN